MHRFTRDELKPRPATAFAERRAVRFQDVDAAGIIFYPRLLEYFHDTYVSFLAAAGTPLPEVLREGSWISPVRHAEADYFRPLRFGDEVEVALVRAHLEPTEVTVGYRIAGVETGEVAAVGQVVHTFLEAASFQRTAIPDALRRAYFALGA
jgi:YbgC/YbaW family acyl-CoA thioester hydrolase